MWALIKFSSAIEHHQTMFFVDTQAKPTVVVLLVVYHYVSVTLLVRIYNGKACSKDAVKGSHNIVNLETTSSVVGEKYSTVVFFVLLSIYYRVVD